MGQTNNDFRRNQQLDSTNQQFGPSILLDGQTRIAPLNANLTNNRCRTEQIIMRLTTNRMVSEEDQSGTAKKTSNDEQIHQSEPNLTFLYLSQFKQFSNNNPLE
jgi:hypothetical protein